MFVSYNEMIAVTARYHRLLALLETKTLLTPVIVDCGELR